MLQLTLSSLQLFDGVLQLVGTPLDGGRWIVELVSDASAEGTELGHSFSLAEHGLRVTPAGKDGVQNGSCIHCGIPSVIEAGGNLSYSSPHQTFINAAMARVNTWITGFPSAQTGGSTSLSDVTPQALTDSELSRNALRKYGVHIVRHAMGALGSLNFFSLEKFLEDCERERRSKTVFDAIPKDKGVIPMYFPNDFQALAGIREIAEKGNPKDADHTLKNVDSFRQWENTIRQAAKKKLYYPQLNDTVIDSIKSDA